MVAHRYATFLPGAIGVVDYVYFSRCDVYSIGDVVLNFCLCAIAPLGAAFARLRLAFV
jgi:hypothetical protein